MKKFEVLLWCLLFNSIILAGPEAGDIFREFVYIDPNGHFNEADPEHPRGKKRAVQQIKQLDLDIQGAIKAEMSVEYWGGHIGTSEQKFKVNGNNWIYIPQPHNTPGTPEHYYRCLFGNESVLIPLDHLKQGKNNIQFTCGKQIYPSNIGGFYWIYSFTIRVYYHSSISHPTGRIITPVSGSEIGDSPELRIEASSSNSVIKQVDYIGYYEDFDWEGNGLYKQWHYQTREGILNRHIGTSRQPPYSLIWDNVLLPDQENPISIMAKVTDNNGISIMTPVVDNISLVRRDRSVKMYKSYDVPKKFCARDSRPPMLCKINVNQDLSNAKSARMIVSTWSGKTPDGSVHEIGLNGKRISDNFGLFHNYSLDLLSVPLAYLKKGINEIHIYSEFKGHYLEINWPGPVLIIEYDI
jgi:hypothetical protein